MSLLITIGEEWAKESDERDLFSHNMLDSQLDLALQEAFQKL